MGLQIRQKLSSLGPIFACQTPQVRQAPRIMLIPQRWPARRGNSGWARVFAEVIQNRPHGRRIDDERDDLHLPSAKWAHQGKDFINPCDQHCPQITRRCSGCWLWRLYRKNCRDTTRADGPNRRPCWQGRRRLALVGSRQRSHRCQSGVCAAWGFAAGALAHPASKTTLPPAAVVFTVTVCSAQKRCR